MVEEWLLLLPYLPPLQYVFDIWLSPCTDWKMTCIIYCESLDLDRQPSYTKKKNKPVRTQTSQLNTVWTFHATQHSLQNNSRYLQEGSFCQVDNKNNCIMQEFRCLVFSQCSSQHIKDRKIVQLYASFYFSFQPHLYYCTKNLDFRFESGSTRSVFM